MPSVGSILLTIQAKTDDLEKQLSKAQQKIRELEGTAKKSGAGMATSLNAASKATSALGDNFGRSVGQKLAQGMLLASSAMKVFDKNMDDTTKGILDGGAKVAAAWAMGSPMMAAVIGALEIWAYKQDQIAKKLKETQDLAAKQSALRIDAAEMLTSLMREDETSIDKINRKIREQGEIIEAVQSKVRVAKMFGDANGNLATNEAEIRDRVRAVDLLREQLKMEQALEGLRLGDLSRSKEIEALHLDAAGVSPQEIALMQQIATYQEKIAALREVDTDAARRTVRELSLQVAGAQKLLDLTRKTARSKADTEIGKEIELRSAVSEELRRQIELSRELDEWTKKGASPALIEQLKAATLRTQVIQSWRPIFQSIESALTDAIVDGLTNGFKNGGDIAKRLVDTLLSQLIGSIVSSGINALMGGLFGGIGGGGGGGLASIVTAVIGGVTGGGGGGGGAGGVLSLPDP